MTAPYHLFALLAAAAAGTAQPLGPKPTLHTPDLIAPAVLPYLACLYAQRGLPLLRAADGTQVAFDKSSGDCSAARDRARADAAKLLQGNAVPGGIDADLFIEETLGDMDAYVASLPVADADHSAQREVIGIPLTIEDEVQPAYARYDDCLKTQASGTRVTAATVIATFRQAMTTCRSVRDDAVAEATRALAPRGWDEERRRQAAESTFAKADDSWIALGQQYRALLVRRAGAAVASPKGKRD